LEATFRTHPSLGRANGGSGARTTCSPSCAGAAELAVGIYGQLAGEEVSLGDAIARVFAAWYGDLISLLPGRLA
jgi:hypothetical protein